MELQELVEAQEQVVLQVQMELMELQVLQVQVEVQVQVDLQVQQEQMVTQVLQEQGDLEAAKLERARFEQLSNAAARLRQLESDEEYAPGDPELPRQRALVHHALGDARRAEQALRRWLALRGDDLPAHLQALDLIAPSSAFAGQVAARVEELAGTDAAAWKRLEALWSERGDQARRLAAGERWRRLERGR